LLSREQKDERSVATKAEQRTERWLNNNKNKNAGLLKTLGAIIRADKPIRPKKTSISFISQ